MKPALKRADENLEFETDEKCCILEVANDDGDDTMSISRARVAPGVTTQWHELADTDERYLIVSGEGHVEVGEFLKTDVRLGDVVRIPRNTPQRITNTGANDLLFYCLCTPRFQPSCYVERTDLE
jgi:mannose-6-phosphate isomerase-like protein (cupin superfamily)